MDPFTAIAVLVIASLLSAVLAPRPPQPKPPALGDFNVPTAEEGRPIPVVFGDVWVTGPNVLWYGALRTEPIRKGGGGKK